MLSLDELITLALRIKDRSLDYIGVDREYDYESAGGDTLRAIDEAATIRGAFRYGRLIINPWIIPQVNLFIVGSVVVSRINGVRLGKGGGYSDLEYAILLESGRIEQEVPIVTIVHDIQVINKPLRREKHDVPVDVIVTPTKVMNVIERADRPEGLIPEILSDEHKSLPIVKYVLERKKGNEKV